MTTHTGTRMWSESIKKWCLHGVGASHMGAQLWHGPVDSSGRFQQGGQYAERMQGVEFRGG